MPFIELGDIPYEKAPIRKCHLLSYDGDRYMTVEVEGKKYSLVEVPAEVLAEPAVGLPVPPALMPLPPAPLTTEVCT